jgi:hypothetical protein
VSTQALKYNFGSKRASVNTSAGVGFAFRYFGDSAVGDKTETEKLGFQRDDFNTKLKYDAKKDRYTLPIYRITPACRANSSDVGTERKKKLATSVFSIIPTLYAAKPEDQSDLSVQPALLVGFFDDIISVGPGFNLTGPEKGKVFLLLSIGYGFKF